MNSTGTRQFFLCLIAWGTFVLVAMSLGQLSAFEPIRRLPATEATGYPQNTSWPTNDGPRYSTAQARQFEGFDLPPPVGWQAEESFIQGDPSPVMPMSTKISNRKSGIFQRFSFTETWLEGGRIADVGMNELEMYATFALPLPTADHPLLITPGFETIFLNGPITPDLPGQVYSAYAQFLWIPRISDRWTAFVGINPGMYGDYETSTEVFRLLGRGMLRYDWMPDYLQLMFGVLYLDRDDYSILPAGGVIWTPSDDVRFDILFPQPKLAYRFSYSERHEDWFYLGGEFGGDTWAVRRASGADDRITLRDLRLLFGVERKYDGGAGVRFEIGYVFSRVVEYASATPDIDLDSTLLLRGGFTF